MKITTYVCLVQKKQNQFSKDLAITKKFVTTVLKPIQTARNAETTYAFHASMAIFLLIRFQTPTKFALSAIVTQASKFLRQRTE